MRPSLWICLALLGCEADALDPVPDAAGAADAGADAQRRDLGGRDAALDDAGHDAAGDATADMILDAAGTDGALGADATPEDAAPEDAAPEDATPPDAALEDATPADATPEDATPADATPADATPDMTPDAGPPGPRSDDFDGATLAPRWQIYRPEAVDLTVQGGALHLAPRPFALWFDRERGPLVYQPVDGDFRATARVRARRRAAPDEPPDQLVHLGGLMARDPVTPPEDYVFIVVGRDIDDLSVETKTTVAGRSAYTGPPWPDSDAALRICRLGDTFRLYKRPIDGGEWILADTFDRPDLPATLQVGAIAYTNSAMPDLTVAFEEIVFAPAAAEADCTED